MRRESVFGPTSLGAFDIKNRQYSLAGLKPTSDPPSLPHQTHRERAKRDVQRRPPMKVGQPASRSISSSRKRSADDVRSIVRMQLDPSRQQAESLLEGDRLDAEVLNPLTVRNVRLSARHIPYVLCVP
jgi:hypothetical protein